MAIILVVEDEPSIQRLVEQVLKIDGHQVAIYGTLAALKETPNSIEVDLAIIDGRLPDGNGAGLAEELHAGGKVKVLFTSASEKVNGPRHLPKPFTPNELLSAVAELLAKPAPTTS